MMKYVVFAMTLFVASAYKPLFTEKAANARVGSSDCNPARDSEGHSRAHLHHMYHAAFLSDIMLELAIGNLTLVERSSDTNDSRRDKKRKRKPEDSRQQLSTGQERSSRRISRSLMQ